MPYTVTIHSIIDLDNLVIDGGAKLPNKPKTLNGAKRIARDVLGGSLWRRPEDVAHIVGPDHDGWHFMGQQESRSGRYVSLSLKLYEHTGDKFTIKEG